MQVPSFNELSWIDLTSLGVVITFLVLGFFRGLLWQVSRFASLILGWVIAQSFAGGLAAYIHEDLELVSEALAPYVAFFTIFLTVLILLSLLTMLIQSYVEKLKLSLFNRIGGAAFGVATATGLLIGLFGISYAFFGRTAFAGQIRESHAGRVCHAIVQRLDPLLSAPLVRLYDESAKDLSSSKDRAGRSGKGESGGKESKESGKNK